MKHNIIKTDNYLLVVDDSEIKAGDYGFITSAVMSYDAMLKEWNQPLGSKIIAHLPLNNSPILEGVPLLPPLEQEDDVEKLAEEEYPIIPNTSPNVNWDRANKQEGFERGYNKAREKCIKEIDKQISDFKHDLKESTSTFVKQNCEGAIFGLMRLKESLSQPKTPTHFEFEMEDKVALDGHTVIGKEIKTTTNSQGQQVACGKYIY